MSKSKWLREFIQYSLNAPKIKRTHIYASDPLSFGMRCPRGRHKIEWSEFERHIWCYRCEKDYFLPQLSGYSGIFSGPIMIQVAQLMGADFRRINLLTNEIIPFETDTEENNKKYNATYHFDEGLHEYESKYKGWAG